MSRKEQIRKILLPTHASTCTLKQCACGVDAEEHALNALFVSELEELEKKVELKQVMLMVDDEAIPAVRWSDVLSAIAQIKEGK